MSFTICRQALKSYGSFEMSKRDPDLTALYSKGSRQLSLMMSLKRLSFNCTSQSKKLAMMLITLKVYWERFLRL